MRIVLHKTFSSIGLFFPTEIIETQAEFSIFDKIDFFRFFSDFQRILRNIENF